MTLRGLIELIKLELGNREFCVTDAPSMHMLTLPMPNTWKIVGNPFMAL